MSTAPSAGAKVTLGQDAPVTREGAGAVPNDSLAAQSYREDGAFASNRGGQPDGQDSGNSAKSTSGSAHAAAGAGVTQSAQGGAAPSYVANQYISDTKGPHGKNITEGGFSGEAANTLGVEPGSKDDPARAAIHGLEKAQAQSAGDIGPKQGEVDNKQPFGVLGSETNA